MMSALLSPTISAASSLDSPRMAPRHRLATHSTTRRRLAPSQTNTLVSVFEVKTHPSREERALLAAELGMELKAVNSWFQNKRRSLKKTWSSSCGWSKGSLPENKHVRPLDGPRALQLSDSALSLERVASSHELPYKRKTPATQCPPARVPITPRRRATTSRTSNEILEHLPSSPPTRPSSPTHGEPLLALEPREKRVRSLEWACAKARAERRASLRVKAAKVADWEDDSDVPMLVLDGIPRDQSSVSGDDSETEEDEAITPNVSTELLPHFLMSLDADTREAVSPKKRAKGKDMDMEAAIVLLGFMSPEPSPPEA
ncbi:hypothetical protein C8Q80DRAFT_1224329 [Daedaleopsis nitida]|nr:hypothetical protein C8Q80DRAFT_1224329 [Daedaleopsis nitida]